MDREMSLLRKLRAIGSAGGLSLIAMALVLTPALAASTQRTKALRPASSYSGRAIGAFTPAVADPRLAAALARRGTSLNTEFRFTPATVTGDHPGRVRVAVRASSVTPLARDVGLAAAPEVTAITPSAYNLGVSVGWRRFAISGDVSQVDNGVIAGHRESAQVGMSYRANRRITGRVAVAAERADGNQRFLTENEAYSLDVGGAYSIARNIDVTAGARYRISRDRLEPLAGAARRDSQAVYIGTAFRF
jgi:hypothetical protein